MPVKASSKTLISSISYSWKESSPVRRFQSIRVCLTRSKAAGLIRPSLASWSLTAWYSCQRMMVPSISKTAKGLLIRQPIRHPFCEAGFVAAEIMQGVRHEREIRQLQHRVARVFHEQFLGRGRPAYMFRVFVRVAEYD